MQMVASNLRFEAGVTRAVGSDMRAEGIDQHLKFSDTLGRYLTSVNAIKRRSIPWLLEYDDLNLKIIIAR